MNYTHARLTRHALRVGGVTAATTCILGLTTLPALAHGIDDDASNRSVPGFVLVGIEHMLLGWDHLLFVAGVLLNAGNPKRAVNLISLFVPATAPPSSSPPWPAGRSAPARSTS